MGTPETTDTIKPIYAMFFLIYIYWQSLIYKLETVTMNNKQQNYTKLQQNYIKKL